MSVFIPETSEPVILASRARRLRKETGNVRYFAAIERRDVKFPKMIKDVMAKPFVVLFHEPMLMAITIYQAVRLYIASVCGNIYLMV